MSLKCTFVAPLWVSASSAAMWKLQVTNLSHLDTGPLPGGTAGHLHCLTSGVWCYHKDWWLLHVACEYEHGESHPPWGCLPSIPLQAISYPSPLHPNPDKVISEPSLISVLQVRRKKGRWQTELSSALSRLKGAGTAPSDIHSMQDIAQSCKQASRSGKSVETPKWQVVAP